VLTGPPGELRATGPRVVGLGGGHGLAATLAAARRYAGELTAVVSVADDGGSSGRLRRDLAIPAPGDLRRCLVALADDPSGPWPEAFGLRFDRGDLAGHALGNLVIAALVTTTGSFPAAVEEAGRLLGACGRVLPATVEPVVLSAVAGHHRLVGQVAIEECEGPIDSIGIEPPECAAPDDVLEAIASADQVVLGPGSLYTSVLAVAVVPAIREALALRGDGVVFVCNLRASQETVGYDVAAHVEALARHGIVPHVVLADTGEIAVGDVPRPGPRLVTAELALPGAWSHDAARLALALESLAAT